ncbi:protein arginine N-methyltransferase 3-like [Argonauta hians]
MIYKMANDNENACDDAVSNDFSWDDCEDEVNMTGPCKCLFCPEICLSADLSLEHLQSLHQINLQELCQKVSFTSYNCIQMINYIRKEKILPSELSEIFETRIFPWNNSKYLVPEDNEDPMLMLEIVPCNFSEVSLSCMDPADLSNPAVGTGGENGVTLTGGAINDDIGTASELDKKLKISEYKCQELSEELKRAVKDLTKIRGCISEIYLNAENTAPQCQCNAVQNLREDEDEAYFGSYGHFGIHREMLQDKVRTEAYRDFILSNPDVFKDKTVLDAGCGTAILSMFAAKAGAGTVYAVDQSEIIYKAMEIVQQNGFEDKIKITKGRIEDVTKSLEKVDVIVTEWMGYFLLFESMLDTVLYARDKLLKPDGFIFPNKCSTHLVAINDQEMHHSHVTYWNDVYGFQMSCMKADVMREASVEVVKPATVISQPCALKIFDISQISLKELDYTAPVSLTITEDGFITALVGYFDAIFDGPNLNSVTFSTGPLSTPTHWKQTVFLIDPQIPVKKDEILTGTLTCMKNRKAPRTLVVRLTIADRHASYIIE